MDLFDEPENMMHEIPMVAISKTKFKLVNGWTFEGKTIKGLEISD